MKKVLIFLLIMVGTVNLSAQSPKREMRSVWLATVWAIDWPSTKVSSTGNTSQINNQKNGMIRYLDSIKSANMNTVFFQVRSRCDAMYNSAYEPWSSDLVTTRGMDPGWDPLAFAVEEAHKRGIELHAWLNPYRYETLVGQFTGPKDYRTTNPEWLLDYGTSYSILNPGLPEVRQRITDVVKDIITKYDVDGIVFDDYFYKYGGTPVDLDLATQQLYKPASMDVHDWRRKNVNDMVLQVYNMIQEQKPWVTFGISPFGIWTTNGTVAAKEGVPLPTGITGGNMYQEIYCDPITWLKQGSVDYVSPQLYWPTYSTGQDYDVLAPWWADVCLRFGKHFYSSHTLSGLSGYYPAPAKISSNSAAKSSAAIKSIIRNNEVIPLETLSPFEKTLLLNSEGNQYEYETVSVPYKAPEAVMAVTPQEIGLQITRNRLSAKDDSPGSVFFSANGLYVTGFTKYLKTMMFTQKSLTPAINWKPATSFGLLNNIAIVDNKLVWDAPGNNIRYSIYAVPASRINDPSAISTSEFLKGISYTNSFDITGINTSEYVLGVAVLDRYGNEYPVRFITQSSVGTTPATTLLSPANGSTVVYGTAFPSTFTWTEVSGVYAYIFEVATDAGFANIVFSRTLTSNSFSSSLLSELVSGNVYYWRVKTRMAGSEDGISAVRDFKNQTFAIISPVYGQTNVSIEPTIKWGSVGSPDATYKMEISTTGVFGTIVYSVNTNLLETTVPVNKLLSATTYFVRVTAITTAGNISTQIIMFKTATQTPDVPVIFSPNDNSGVDGLNIHIEWNDDVRATSYRLEISQDPQFPPRSITVLDIPAFTYFYDFIGTANTVYYTRVRANYGSGLFTDWSNTVIVNLATGLNELKTNQFKAELLKVNDTDFNLELDLINPGFTRINVYSVTGILLKTVHIGYLQQGIHHIPVNFEKSMRGVYLLSVEVNGQNAVKRFIR